MKEKQTLVSRERKKEFVNDKGRKVPEKKEVANGDVCFDYGPENNSVSKNNKSFGVLHKVIINTPVIIQDSYKCFLSGKVHQIRGDQLHEVNSNHVIAKSIDQRLRKLSQLNNNQVLAKVN